ncbi:peptide chain release factor N(5)-glutamine methyltransferase [Acidithiobacillus montserratensis]|uniref:Peptide chain release factor N(5)-glutamine methyltransferase n=1 Tax=Acidithiobacillus montserratensis TaxID=2729135 RepID=A0ACD5HJ81_9PROT|nr:peptide chain release factor N(5)-glutamine methyltransferase [Acidithiobacillus montserratensis]MBN2678611.1 peptide chain release factor N(5)-glutamine methyltransferase [Acidithiobacillaceae bacterium]MBU2747142.1 peptide chain release factor N(5)-glutamine methyltransferase [Acidithiobacillus montserratensis]
MTSFQEYQRWMSAQLATVSDQPAQEARWLMARSLGLRPAELLVNAHQFLSSDQKNGLQKRLDERLRGVPMAYCLGEWSFYGLDLEVNTAVLIPRPDSELLIHLALAEAAGDNTLQILDLGTGSGALALAMAVARPQARVFAVEQSPEALAVARRNGEKLGAKVEWLEGDWFTPLDPTLRFDLIVSNPPYLASADPHLPELQHEPLAALVAGPSGLECLESIIQGAGKHLHPGGQIFLEHGWEQGAAVRKLLHTLEFQQVQTHADIAGRERVTTAGSPNHA